MQRYDVIVIGAGIAGSSAAYELARDSRVLVLEQHRFLHALGSSHGGSRIFRYAYPERQYVEMALASERGWHELEDVVDDRLLTRTGGLDIGRAGSDELVGIESALEAAGQTVERLAPREVAARYPAFALADDEVALYQPDAGVLAPTRSVNAFLRAAAQRGAELRDEEPVVAVDLAGGGARVRTTNGEYLADRLVITAGPWLGSLLADLNLPLTVEQQQVLYVCTSRSVDFAPARMPIFINHDVRNAIYGFPLFDDPVAIKISDHMGAPKIRLEERGSELMQERAEETIRRARRLMPALTGDMRAFQLCLYTKTPDEHFILDRHPEHPQVVIGGGFSGHGFKFGPALGQVLRELSLGENPSFDLSLFKLQRLLSQ